MADWALEVHLSLGGLGVKGREKEKKGEAGGGDSTAEVSG